MHALTEACTGPYERKMKENFTKDMPKITTSLM